MGKIEEVREEYLKERQQVEETTFRKPALPASVQRALGVHNDEDEYDFVDDKDITQQGSPNTANGEDEEGPWEEVEAEGPVNVNEESKLTNLKTIAGKTSDLARNLVYAKSSWGEK
jgi:hypothetical protein